MNASGGFDRCLREATKYLIVTRPDRQAKILQVDYRARTPQEATRMLRDGLAHEHQQPNPADLSGVLAGGTFHRDDRLVYGQWPISRAFVDSLTGEAY